MACVADLLDFGVLGSVILLCGGGARILDSGCSRAESRRNFSHELATVSLAAQVEHSAVHIVEVLLLGAEDRARPRNSDPSNEGRRREPEMLHAVEANQGARAPQTRLAVDGDRSWFVLGGRQELRHDLIRRCRPIDKEEVHVLDALLGELGLLVLRFIQANDKRHTQALENRHVVVRSERTVPVCHVERAREGDKLVRHDPVEVAVLHLLEVLVLLHVERAVVVPAERHRVLQPLETVQVSATVGAITHGGVAVGDEFVVVGAESLPGLVGRFVEHDKHEGAHKEGRVALLCVV